ncbi:MAG: hypothetical protein ACI4EA_04600 [Candidatus Ornithomonoglobus sp.]
MKYNISNLSPDEKLFFTGESSDLIYPDENMQCSICKRKIKANECFYIVDDKIFCRRDECAKYAKQAILNLVEDDYIYEN